MFSCGSLIELSCTLSKYVLKAANKNKSFCVCCTGLHIEVRLEDQLQVCELVTSEKMTDKLKNAAKLICVFNYHCFYLSW